VWYKTTCFVWNYDVYTILYHIIWQIRTSLIRYTLCRQRHDALLPDFDRSLPLFGWSFNYTTSGIRNNVGREWYYYSLQILWRIQEVNVKARWFVHNNMYDITVHKKWHVSVAVPMRYSHSSSYNYFFNFLVSLLCYYAFYLHLYYLLS